LRQKHLEDGSLGLDESLHPVVLHEQRVVEIVADFLDFLVGFEDEFAFVFEELEVLVGDVLREVEEVGVGRLLVVELMVSLVVDVVLAERGLIVHVPRLERRLLHEGLEERVEMSAVHLFKEV
jgi:hypothetical protein